MCEWCIEPATLVSRCCCCCHGTSLPLLTSRVQSLVNAVKKLMLAHNELERLPELGAFNLPPLVQLVASHNALTEIPASVAGLVEIIELDVSHNRLGTLPTGIGGMRALQRLLLAKNQLVELPVDLVRAPPPLISLDASENHLSLLQLSVPTLRTLQLANNRLQRLDLHGCVGLQELSAPFNTFVQLPAGLPSLPHLATVDLGSNQLADVATLTSCASLTRLDLSCNEIREVPPTLGLLSLNRLALTGNPLRTMPSSVLNGPTPKLLAHLRGKIVDVAPQWEGDARGAMVPMPLDYSMAALGVENRSSQYSAGAVPSHAAHSVDPRCHPHAAAPPYGAFGAHGTFGAHGASARCGQLSQGAPHGTAEGFVTASSGFGGGWGHGAPPPRADARQPDPHGSDPRQDHRGFDALYNRPPSLPSSARGPPGPGPPHAGEPPGHRYGAPSVSASAPFQTETNARTEPPASSLDGLYSHVVKDGTELAVGNMKLTQLPESGYPTTLLTISAAANQLTHLPEALAEAVPTLRCLDVSRNALQQLPSDLSCCSELQVVRAGHNQLRDLHFLRTALPALTELHADRNGLSEIPPALWMCPRLRSVSLCANRLTAASLHLGEAAVAPLEYLDLGENRLGSLPPLALFPRLREVHVQQNGIRVLPVPQLLPLQQLQTFDLSCNDVSTLPPQLALLPQLQNLNIVGNAIRSIPQNVQQRGATAVLDLLRKRLPPS